MARNCSATCYQCCYQGCWPAGAPIAVDQILGSAAFGAAAIIAAVVSNAGQSIELVR